MNKVTGITPTQTEPNLRIAFVVGTLSRGGAEKQFLYMVRALKDSGAEVRAYCLTQGEYHEERLRDLGVPIAWIGKSESRVRRLWTLANHLREFRPHIVQSSHFYTNLYAGLAGKLLRIPSIGAIRNDVTSEIADSGSLGAWQLRITNFLICNSAAAKQKAEEHGVDPNRIGILSNVIDLEEFDAKLRIPAGVRQSRETCMVVAAGRLVPQKRFDRFIETIAKARAEHPSIVGIIAGEGPLREELEQRIGTTGLDPEAIRLLGVRSDVPAILGEADIFLLTSDHEGFPNVVLEAMAARLPVVMTPVGDAGSFVEEGVSGYIVPFEDIEGMAARIVELAESPDKRRALGANGRARVQRDYGFDGVTDRLQAIYSRLRKDRR